ncbi:ATP-dependent DNA helicase [Ascosphaera apis ARSEF 7405]|uniref:DNA 3'-5' helicase n=1 Tax=Ascosphaera apis ARSEF 7405 TaxID=392613 RepID=A0A162IHN3_9EURO|nr:ATP-dependent DNA helicase [Ascosphaera apis ARSEF 7405]
MVGTSATARQAAGDRRYKRRRVTAYQLASQIGRADHLSLSQLQDIIRKWRESPPVDEVSADMTRITRAALKLLLDGRDPRQTQVDVMTTLLFKGQDVLLAAKTGFGKSVIFSSFGALTGTTTIVILPLLKLADEQMRKINLIPGSRACLVDGETKYKDRDLLRDIAACKYTHILMGPEQAASPEVRAAMRVPEFQRSVGMVAIDEIHLLVDWEFFRTDYVLLQELRRIVPHQTVWFGCTATLTAETEKEIKNKAGFRAEFEATRGLDVIKTSVNRPEISISIVKIKRNKLSDFSPILFILNDAVDKPLGERDQGIPKTIIFADSYRVVNAVADYMINSLARQSIAPGAVSIFTSRTSQYDKDLTYDEFCSNNSSIRIMVATTALGMGMDIPDVEVIIQWGLPTSKSIADLWQRFGRSARSPGKTGKAIAFLPHHVFDKPRDDGDPSGAEAVFEASSVADEMERSQRRKRNALRMPQNLMIMTPASSQAHTTPTQSQAVQDDDIMSQASDQTNLSIPSNITGVNEEPASNDAIDRALKGKKKELIKAEEKKKLAIWYHIVSAPCIRRAILALLQENIQLTTDAEYVCCNRCNASITPAVRFMMPPPPCQQIRKPTKNSRAGFALQKLQTWCESQASRLEMIEGEERSIVPAYLYMPSEVQYKIVRIFNKGNVTAKSDMGVANVEQLEKIINRNDWHLFDREAENLLAFLHSIREEVIQKHQSLITPSTQASQQSQASSASPLFALSDLSPLSLQTPTPKRGRGRPRAANSRIRHPLANANVPSNEDNHNEPARRGRPRGRPRTRTLVETHADILKKGLN